MNAGVKFLMNAIFSLVCYVSNIPSYVVVVVVDLFVYISAPTLYFAGSVKKATLCTSRRILAPDRKM